VAFAFLEVCLNSIDKTLCPPLHGELVEFDACFYCLGFRGSMGFAIDKPCVLFAALLSLHLGVCHPYGLV
jgi:hypothetical protein